MVDESKELIKAVVERMLRCAAVEVGLADFLGEVALFFESLRDGELGERQPALTIPEISPTLLVASGDQSRSGGRANRCGGIGVREIGAEFGNSINPRGCLY